MPGPKKRGERGSDDQICMACACHKKTGEGKMFWWFCKREKIKLQKKKKENLCQGQMPGVDLLYDEIMYKHSAA